MREKNQVPGNEGLARAACAAGCAVLLLLFHGRILFGAIPVSTDMILMYAPFYSLKWDGGPPLWNPCLAGGMSMLGNLQFSAWYPPRWPFYFISDWRGYFGPFMFLHYAIALAGTWGTMRALGLGRAAAFTGALVFALGGYMTARIMNTTIFLASCWFPCLVWGAADTRRFGGLAALAGMAMILLVGSPHLIIYGGVGFAVVWGALRLGTSALTAPPGGGWKNRLVLGPWLWLCGGVVIGLPALIPGLMQVRGSIRTLTDMGNNLADSLRWGEIPFTVLGGLGGAMVPEVNDKCLYIGGAGLLMVLLSCAVPGAARDRRWRCGWALVVTGLVMALGQNIGWQFVNPWIPGLKLLEGPARALVLTAFGFALLCALAVDRLDSIGWRRRLAVVVATAVLIGLVSVAAGLRPPGDAGWDGFLEGWLRVPGSVIGRPFASLDGWLTLVPAAAVLLAWPRGRGGVAWTLLLILALQFRHFAPRVWAETELPEAFDPPANVKFLMDRAREEDFRIAAFDPLQAHDVEWNNLHKVKFLMPNLSTLYGLRDIRGFDPLIPLEHQRLVRETAGLAPFNDPIRNVDIGRPDDKLFERMGVQYLIGNPNDRRVTHLPVVVTPDRPVAEVEAWREAGITAPVSAWMFVSLVDGRDDLPMGTPVAQIILGTDRGEVVLPVRMGLETAHIRAGETVRESDTLQVNMRWQVYTPDRRQGFRAVQQNYRARIGLPEPVAVHSVRWELLRRDVILYMGAQACRLAEVEGSGRWFCVFEDDVAPVHRRTRP